MVLTSSPSVSTAPAEPRPEAGPLPSKRGEIGFREDLHALVAEEGGAVPSPTVVLPPRHPADRDAPPPITASYSASSATPSAANATAPSASTPVPTPTSTPATSPTTPDDASSTMSLGKKKGILCFLKPKRIPSFFGLRLTTLLVFTIQVLVIAGTIAGWVLAIQHLASGNSSDSNNMLSGSSMAIFVHVSFGIAVLGQMLFLERRLFRLRAERYSYLHPGEMLPRSRRRAVGNPPMGIVPWNRPPLPSYAAALAQSGVGTGDVEDHLIAAPPPPAYGITRGSTLLLAGFLRDSLRAQRPVSVRSQMSEVADRPLSYVSHDEEWEEIQDALRARRLEETLAQLERPASAHSRR